MNALQAAGAQLAEHPQNLSECGPSSVSIRPGDIILSSSLNTELRRIQDRCGSPWSHVSLVIGWPNESGSLALLESTKRPVSPDLKSGQFVIGVQIVSLNEKLAAFPGRIVHRRLVPPLSEPESHCLRRFAEKMWAQPFNNSPYYAARARRRRNSSPSSLGLLCAELVASAYHDLGVLIPPPDGRSANNYSPSDFAQESESLNLELPWSFFGQRPLRIPEAGAFVTPSSGGDQTGDVKGSTSTGVATLTV
jgi:hypothetical protein